VACDERSASHYGRGQGASDVQHLRDIHGAARHNVAPLNYHRSASIDAACAITSDGSSMAGSAA
jgi:hypothetical protein